MSCRFLLRSILAECDQETVTAIEEEFLAKVTPSLAEKKLKARQIKKLKQELGLDTSDVDAILNAVE